MGANLVKGTSRAVRKIAGYITNAAGVAAISTGSGVTVVRNGVGDLTLTLRKPGRRFLHASITPMNATAATSHTAKMILDPTATAIQIGTYVADGVDGAPADMSFSFEITVSDTAV